jgi:hypothetical protein
LEGTLPEYGFCEATGPVGGAGKPNGSSCAPAGFPANAHSATNTKDVTASRRITAFPPESRLVLDDSGRVAVAALPHEKVSICVFRLIIGRSGDA